MIKLPDHNIPKLKIGGVPEHFNYPWKLLLKKNKCNNLNVPIEWIDFPSGTGAMKTALENKQIDVAIMLTEGVVKAIIENSPFKILQTYVKSPLHWGIHVAENSRFKKITELRGNIAAISRHGSGSHLMSYCLAQHLNWDLQKDLKFKTVHDLAGGCENLQNNKAQYFMWERFTTKPMVDQGSMRCLGTFPSPWPCFVIVAHKDIIKNQKNAISSILNQINIYTKDFKKKANIASEIAKYYSLKQKDIEKWLQITEWSQELPSKKDLDKVQSTLKDLQLVSKNIPYRNFIP